MTEGRSPDQLKAYRQLEQIELELSEPEVSEVMQIFERELQSCFENGQGARHAIRRTKLVVEQENLERIFDLAEQTAWLSAYFLWLKTK